MISSVILEKYFRMATSVSDFALRFQLIFECNCDDDLTEKEKKLELLMHIL